MVDTTACQTRKSFSSAPLFQTWHADVEFTCGFASPRSENGTTKSTTCESKLNVKAANDTSRLASSSSVASSRIFCPLIISLVDQLDYHLSILSTARLGTAVDNLIIHGEESEPSFSMAEAAAKGTRNSEV